jgi:hypothetical protein
MSLRINIITLIMLALSVFTGHGQQVKALFRNQMAIWAAPNFRDPMEYHVGGRYIPTLNITDSLSGSRKLEAELSFNIYVNKIFKSNENNPAAVIHKPYRAWIRYSTPRLELGAGLQNITFGSAAVLRPLMWFDKTDYRDPLQITDGVLGFQGTYFFRNKSDIRFWALYGNHNTRGWEIVPTWNGTPELGGRYEFPVPKGVAAVSIHHRAADYTAYYGSVQAPNQLRFPEEKIGLDGKWDLGVGLRFEYVLKHNSKDLGFIREWENYLSLGVDHTFNVGNGLNLVGEYFRYSNIEDLKTKGVFDNFTLFSLDYPLNPQNSLKLMAYYNWNANNLYRYISYQRKFNFITLYLMAFWNPMNVHLYGPAAGFSPFDGKGIQVMMVVEN